MKTFPARRLITIKQEIKPHWFTTFGAPWLPVLASFILAWGTLTIAEKSNVFDANNKFIAAGNQVLEAKKLNLEFDIKRFEGVKDSLQQKILAKSELVAKYKKERQQIVRLSREANQLLNAGDIENANRKLTELLAQLNVITRTFDDTFDDTFQ